MLKFFINSVGYEIKFEAEWGAGGGEGAPMGDHFNKSHIHKKDDEEEDEEESNGSNNKTEWKSWQKSMG